MSQFEEKIALYESEARRLNLEIDTELLRKVTRYLGPSIYNADSEKVACSDPKELARIKENFLIGKLGLKDGPELGQVLERVCDEYELKTKYRSIFYYILIAKFQIDSDNFLG